MRPSLWVQTRLGFENFRDVFWPEDPHHWLTRYYFFAHQGSILLFFQQAVVIQLRETVFTYTVDIYSLRLIHRHLGMSKYYIWNVQNVIVEFYAKTNSSSKERRKWGRRIKKKIKFAIVLNLFSALPKYILFSYR